MIQLDKKIDKFIKGRKFHFHLEPFSLLVIDFFDELSKNIFLNKNISKFPDVATFCFWCRKSNLIKLKKNFIDGRLKKGVGLVLHIPPNNVPITSIYSLAFGILSGNANILRIPKKNLKHLKIILNPLEKLLKKKKFSILKENNFLVYYDRSDFISAKLSSISDGRLIWGGDETIKIFKSYQTKLKCSDLFFADRFSVSIFNSDFFKKISNDGMKNLIKNFYNDTFILDQNACSSPHVIFWQGKNIKLAQNIFWSNLESFVKKNYKYTPEIFSKKYQIYNQYLFDFKNCQSELADKQIIFRIDLTKVKKKNISLDNFRGFSGLFFENKLSNLNGLKNIVNEKVQTITYFGYKKNFLDKFIKNTNIKGIDRIVPVGKALNLDFQWDGYNIIDRLTRIIDIA